MLNAFRQGLQKQSNPRHQVGRLHDLEAGKGDSSKPQHSALNSINGVRALCKTPAFVITIDNLCYRGGTWSLRGKEATPSAPALRIRQRLLCHHQDIERLPRLRQESHAGRQFADTLALALAPLSVVAQHNTWQQNLRLGWS